MSTAEEIFFEIEEEIAEVAKITTESMEVVADDLASMSDELINVTDEIEAVSTEVDWSTADELISSDSEVMNRIRVDVSSASDELISLELDGESSSEELPGNVGSSMSLADAALKAGSDAVKGGAEESDLQNIAGQNFTRGLKSIAFLHPGCWYRLKKAGGITIKVIGAYIAIDFIGKGIAGIVNAIEDSTKNPPWKGSLTYEQKQQFVHLSSAAMKLKDVFEGWNEALKSLEENTYVSYGTMETNTGGRKQTVAVIDVCAYLIMDAIQQMETSSAILKKGVNELSTFDLTQITNNVFTTFSNALAMINLRNNKNNMVKDNLLDKFKFPPPKDDNTVRIALITDFPQWKDSVENQGLSIAKMGATYAVGALIKSQVILQVHEYLRENIFPQIREAAKKAGQTAAKNYVEGEKASIIGRALIPVVGPEEARKYGKEVQEEAIKKAKEAASLAGKQKATELHDTIKEALEPIVNDVKEKNKEDMKEIAEYAAKQILKTAFPPNKDGE